MRKQIMQNLEVYRSEECGASKGAPEKVNLYCVSRKKSMHPLQPAA